VIYTTTPSKHPFTPPPEGQYFVTNPEPTTLKLSTGCPYPSTGLWIKCIRLSPVQLTYPQNLWITAAFCGQIQRCIAIYKSFKNRMFVCLWITLWIKGVKAVDKAVDNFVDNCMLWITPDLSTIYPQLFETYPHFCPQGIGGFFGLGKPVPKVIHTIHRPYY
jgi:hypothetical protein